MQAAIYGKCIVADYNAVHKDKCAAEFMKLKDCYIVRSLASKYLFLAQTDGADICLTESVKA